MLKAGALLYAILITLLITIICAMLTEVQYLFYKLYTREEVTAHLNDRIESGLNVVLCKSSLFEYKENQNFTLSEDSTDRITVSKRIWGGFELVKIKSQIGKVKAEKFALIGSIMVSDSCTALYMPNQNNYLYIAGNTKIKGNCWVPAGFVKAGYIEGKQYVGNTTVEGATYKSGPTLPEINNEIIFHSTNYLSHVVETDSILPYGNIGNQLNIQNSFEKKTLLINSNEKILLVNCRLSGNIIVRSEKMIEIDSSAKLQDIIIYAPKIKIKSFFTGVIQVIATDTISIDKNCKLKYPSFVCALCKKPSLIEIKEGSLVQGAIVLYQTGISEIKKSKVSIEKGCEIYGVVFSNESVEHMGKVCGTIYCKNFVLQIKSSFYENYLLDSEINATDLSKFYVGSVLFKNNINRKLIGWLN